VKIFKFAVVFLCITCAIVFVVAATMIIKQNMTDISINDSIKSLTNNVKYKNPVKTETENIPEINIISASTNSGFYTEIKKQFPDYKITQYKNIKNSELLDKIYEALSNDILVICRYAAADNSETWAMDYCVITEIDIPGDKITVKDSNGYTETYAIKDFLKATRFEISENMEFYLKLGFAAEIFTKNTVYIIEKN